MSEIIASVSGVRGIFGDNLTPQNISKFTSAFAEYCRKNSKSRKIVVGRDGRLNGEIISNLVINNLLLSGFEVVYIGISPTPTVQIATNSLKAAGGIAVTASHNPQKWNGLKFLSSNGTFLEPLQIKEFLSIAEKGNFKYASVWDIKKLTFDLSWLDKHIEKVLNLKILDSKVIKKRKFRIVIDAVNSAASIIAPKLLKKLGCEVIELFCDGSGIFPHTPEPIPENLKQLCSAVKKYKADVGFAIDPDSDRLVIITEKGEPYIEENTVVTAANFVLRKSKQKNKSVCVNLSTTRAVDDIAKKWGAKSYRSAVGEINVVKEMKKRKSIIGGEGSGGIIYPEMLYGRGAIGGLAMILQEFAESKISVSEYKNALPQYYISKAKIENVKNPDKILKTVISRYKNSGCKITTIDGVKLDFPEYWIHLRKSNTEPIIRIITEAKSRAEADSIQQKFISEIKKLI
ncbi:MAG: phosphoglucosamine mutase [Bacteroidetes bacterium]|nr:phosphoglucosamine mutase [Bacteroidota bacterium]